MIEVKNLSKNYGAYRALDDVSFSIRTGEIVGFLGPNGAGKTTTMKILTGFIPATSGSAVVANFDVAKDSLEVRKRIGYLPEMAPLYHEMNVKAYLEYVADIRKLNKFEKEKRIDLMVERCSLEDVIGKDIGELSKGYKQRVGLAQAMIHDPEILILDEPITGLDPNQILEIRDLIRDMGREKTIILSTHILQEVTAVCSRILIINRGKIVAEGSPESLKRDMAGGPFIEMELKAEIGDVNARLPEIQILGNIEMLEAFGQQRTRLGIRAPEGSAIQEALFDWAKRWNWKILELHTHLPSLEQVFRNITKESELEGDKTKAIEG